MLQALLAPPAASMPVHWCRTPVARVLSTPGTAQDATNCRQVEIVAIPAFFRYATASTMVPSCLVTQEPVVDVIGAAVAAGTPPALRMQHG